MKLNGASKVTGMVIGFLTLLATIVGTYIDTRERLAYNSARIQDVDRRISEVKTDAGAWLIRIEEKIDAKLGAKQ